jgi:uncharacterized protein YjbI with pentapeptide repeats
MAVANTDHMRVLKRGSTAWSAWRKSRPHLKPDLGGANLHGRTLKAFDFKDSNLNGAMLADCDLSGANLTKASLVGATLRDCNLAGGILYGATLRQSDCTGAFFRWADLSRADFTGANLSDADLRRTHLARTVFKNANLSGCGVYGSAVWNVDLDGAVQTDLVITEHDEPQITVDNLEVAQFIYLILNNQKLREVIDSVTSRAVLILGRFTPARKHSLDALRSELRHRGYLPILFDFQAPRSRNLTDTVSTLAHLARFVVADITDAKSIPQELGRIVPFLPRLPVQPILMTDKREYGMFADFLDYPWVLPLYRYKTTAELVQSVGESVIGPPEARAREMLNRAATPSIPLRPPRGRSERRVRTKHDAPAARG